MKKIYMAPDMVIENINFNSILISLSKTPADKDYEGGGDAKSRVVDFSSDDNSFDF